MTNGLVAPTPAIGRTSPKGGGVRYRSRVVRVGTLSIGGDNPVSVQSMTTADTLDTAAVVAEAVRMVRAGCQLVRLTAPTVNDARNLARIKEALRAQGVDVPLVADIHFSPAAALEAAEHVEKVRINPGNYVDSKRFLARDYTDAEYADELDRIEERFAPLVSKLKRLGRALRIGTNHGSLSDRIMNRYGDTPLGMVESALEYVRLCRKQDYHDIVLSMKASNPKVMIAAYRLLAARMDAEGMDYPLHLGVTEAGDGVDGRIKSAIGIGSLLEDGLGDTIRVSLTEDPEREMPVAFAIANRYPRNGTLSPDPSPVNGRGETGVLPPLIYERRAGVESAVASRRPSSAFRIAKITVGGKHPVRIVSDATAPAGPLRDPEILTADFAPFRADGTTAEEVLSAVRAASAPVIASLTGDEPTRLLKEYRRLAALLDAAGLDTPIHISAPAIADPQDRVLQTSILLGSLLCDGIGDSVELRGGDAQETLRLAYDILQGAGVRVTKAEFVSCPSCGRTLFDLQSTTERIKARTAHLNGVKIAIMGCIVNGPGEMADADFGYVGGAPDSINLYVGKDCVKKGVPTAHAVDELVELIKAHGKWAEPSNS